jgi:hypothetical protein
LARASNLARRAAVQPRRAEGCASSPHQRGGHALVGYVGDDHAQAAVVEGEKVVEVAADLARRLPVSGDLPTGEDRRRLGQQRLLDSAGDAQLGLDALAFDRG